MINWYVEQTMADSQERLHDADRQRLIQAARAAAAQHPGLREQALVQVGGWLVATGRRLQVSGGCVPASMRAAEAGEQR